MSLTSRLFFEALIVFNSLRLVLCLGPPPLATLNGTDSNPADLPVVDLGYELHRAIYYNARKIFSSDLIANVFY